MAISSLLHLACASVLLVSSTMGMPTASVQGNPDWQSALERDTHYTFTDRSASLARAALQDAKSTPQRRAAAWVAIAGAGAVAERARCEDAARNTKAPEQLGAILCLGKLAAGGTATLRDLSKQDGIVGECAWLGLLFHDDLEARRALEEMAADGTSARRAMAEDLLLYRYDQGSSRETPAVRAWLNLREGAARHFGLKDGETWIVRSMRTLVLDPDFVRETVLGAAPRITAQGVKDYLMPEFMTSSARSRFDSAMAVMPVEVSQLVGNGLWLPKDGSEWALLLDAVAQRRVEALTPELLAAARTTPFRLRALELAAYSGDTQASFDGFDTTKMREDAKLALCSAVGAFGAQGAAIAPVALRQFEALGFDADPDVAMAWQVAAMRTGQVKPRVDIERILADGTHPSHMALVQALCRNARDPQCADMLETRHTEAVGREKLDIALALTREGRLTGRATLRARLEEDPPPSGAQAAELVAVLRRGATAEDLAVFGALFPRGDDPVFDTQLSIALAGMASPRIVPVLRAGLWRGSHDISLLAAAQLVEVYGMHFLLDEVAAAPRDADDADLRRVGFAIGTWGGIDAVEQLSRARRNNTGDPALQGAVLGALGARTR